MAVKCSVCGHNIVYIGWGPNGEKFWAATSGFNGRPCCRVPYHKPDWDPYLNEVAVLL